MLIRTIIMVTTTILGLIESVVMFVEYGKEGSGTAKVAVLSIALLACGMLLGWFLWKRYRQAHVEPFILNFKKAETYGLLVPMALLHLFTAMTFEIEHSGDAAPSSYWIAAITSIVLVAMATAVLDGSICHPVRLPAWMFLAERVSVLLYRLAEIGTRLIIISLVLIVIRTCDCNPTGFDSVEGCSCPATLVSICSFGIEYTFMLFMLTYDELNRFQPRDDIVEIDDKLRMSRAAMNLIGIQFGSRNRVLQAKSKPDGTAHYFTYAVLMGNVRAWDAVAMLVAKVLTNIVLLIAVGYSDGVVEIFSDVFRRRNGIDSDTSSRFAGIKTTVLVGVIGTGVQLLLFALRTLLFRMTCKRSVSKAMQSKQAFSRAESESAVKSRVVNGYHPC